MFESDSYAQATAGRFTDDNRYEFSPSNQLERDQLHHHFSILGGWIQTNAIKMAQSSAFNPTLVCTLVIKRASTSVVARAESAAVEPISWLVLLWWARASWSAASVELIAISILGDRRLKTAKNAEIDVRDRLGTLIYQT